MIRLILLSLLLSGCALFAPAPVVTTQQTSCTTLIPAEWKAGVPGVELPGLDAAVGELWVAIDGQTGRLDQANGRTIDAIGIVERCEERDKTAVGRATRGFFGRLFGG